MKERMSLETPLEIFFTENPVGYSVFTCDLTGFSYEQTNHHKHIYEIGKNRLVSSIISPQIFSLKMIINLVLTFFHHPSIETLGQTTSLTSRSSTFPHVTFSVAIAHILGRQVLLDSSFEKALAPFAGICPVMVTRRTLLAHSTERFIIAHPKQHSNPH